MSKYVNPLDLVKDQPKQSQSSSTALQSQSMMMEDGGVCPKCNIKMQQCKLADDSPALHCAKCRTTGPIPE